MWLESLRKMKQKSGLTTAEIAAGSGIPEPTLEKLFAGSTKEPKLPTMKKLVYFLGYTLEDLYIEKAPSVPDEALQIAERYDNLDDIGKGAVKAILDYEENRMKPLLTFAARKSDEPHTSTGSDTDVEI